MATLVMPRAKVTSSGVYATGVRPLLLLASDGSAAAAAATRVTIALAAASGADARVVSVLPPQPYPNPEFNGALGAASFATVVDSETAARLKTLGGQLVDASARRLAWPVDIEVGSPAIIIAREARRQAASLVVMGLRRHSTAARWLRDETTLHVVRESPVPVLAVTSALATLPQRVAVAVDFSRASLHAARISLGLLAPNATLYVVYVRPEMERGEAAEGTGIIYSQGIAAAFARLRRELSVPAGTHVEAVLLEGEPVPELISFADAADIDLIAVGSHRHPFLTRLLVGSVTSALVRSARHSLLVAPPLAARGT